MLQRNYKNKAHYIFCENLPENLQIKVKTISASIRQRINELTPNNLFSLRNAFIPSKYTPYDVDEAHRKFFQLCLICEFLPLLTLKVFEGNEQCKAEIRGKYSPSILRECNQINQLRQTITEENYRCMMRYATLMYVLHHYVFDVTKGRVHFSHEVCVALDGEAVEWNLSKWQNDARMILLRDITGYKPKPFAGGVVITRRPRIHLTHEENLIRYRQVISAFAGRGGGEEEEQREEEERENNGDVATVVPIAFAFPVSVESSLAANLTMVEALPIDRTLLAYASHIDDGDSVAYANSSSVLGKRTREEDELVVVVDP